MRTHILHIYFQLKAFIIKLHLENLLEKTYGKFEFGCCQRIPGVSYHWQRLLNANADVIKVVFCLCTVLVLIMLIMIKEYNIDKRYKSGLLLMMANPIWATLKAFSPDTLSTGLPVGNNISNHHHHCRSIYIYKCKSC